MRAYTGSDLYTKELASGWPISIQWCNWRQAGPIALCALFYAVQSTCDKAGLSIVSVTLSQIIKALTPALVFLLAIPIERRRYPLPALGTVLLLVVGCGFSTYHAQSGVHHETLGMLLVLTATAGLALFYTLLKKVMDTTVKDLIPALILVFRLAFFMLIPVRTPAP